MAEELTPEEARMFAKHSKYIDALTEYAEAGGNLDGASKQFQDFLNGCGDKGIDWEAATKDLMEHAMNDELKDGVLPM